MTREQRKHERQRLKSIDMDVLRAAMVLHSLLQDRVVLDHEGTVELITGIIDTLRIVPLGSDKEEV